MARTLLDFLPPADAADEDGLLEGFLEYCLELELELYPAQEEAVLELFANKSVILNTPTGSGKSMVALAVHYMAIAQKKRSFYTAPIKALVSEKFFELCRVLGAENVGMMTGDASVNADAPIICCTAEILSNLALREGEEAKVDFVVMDEFHFYSDPERGVAWQIPLLTLPQSRFLLMSATLGETKLFEETIKWLTEAPCVLVKSEDRPVPLDYQYRETPLHETISDLLDEGKAPIYIVHFTQRQATEQAQNMMSVDFISKDDKSAIKSEILGVRFDSPFGKELRRYVTHGVGVHHAGMLPRYRRMVEKLAQKGLLRVICGTDTLGVGVNVPIRTVLFTQLCKYNGEKTETLRVRDFKQIAGRAGRRGFDAQGSVVAQAPAHVIENQQARNKAGGDAKKLRKLRPKKAPDRGYVHWDKDTFERLISGEPEELVSRFKVSHGMVLEVLTRPSGDGVPALIDLVRNSLGRKYDRRQHARLAVEMVRSLLDAQILKRGDGKYLLDEELQSDFSLNHALALYAYEAASSLSEDDSNYVLDLLTVVESILENPGVVLRRQIDAEKTRLINELKAEGVEYDDRMDRLAEVDYPKPLSDFIYTTFNTFRGTHPWVGDNIRPKSIARDMYERGAGFKEYVKEYGLSRSEGVLLRYLSDAYKTFDQTIPESLKNEDVYDLIDWLEAVVRQADSSLIDEWRRLSDGDDTSVEEVLETRSDDILTNKRAFEIMIRNAVWRKVMLLSRRRFSELAENADVRAPALEEASTPYFEEFQSVRIDAEARHPRHLEILDRGESKWLVRQTLVDPEAFGEWCLEGHIDIAQSRELGDAYFVLERIGPHQA